ncbi:MAG: ABC transporter ATP-binding protein [Pseudodesulfovibrio sp.]
MNTPLLTLENVGCHFRVRLGGLRFKTYQAIRDISFTVARGETLGVIGRNGAGKSTLLKLVAKILRPSNGTIKFHSRLSISLLSLQLGFSPELKGRDNAIMGAMLLGYTKREAIGRLDSIIEFAELGERIEDPLKTYSSGMRARLGFAVAMIMNPDILLVDEALGVGDEAFRKKSTKVMHEKMLSGQTVIFVSHNIHTVRQLCTRVLWLEDGVVKMQGGTDQVLETYLNEG